MPSGNKNGMWKEEPGYAAIHKWLQARFGKANRCENEECDRTRKAFHWAKVQGKEYERKRENFWMLCTKCHFNYDITPERRKRQAAALTGFRHTEEAKRKVSEKNRGKVRTRAMLERYGAAKRGVRHSEETKAKMSASRAGVPRPQDRVKVKQIAKSGEAIRVWDAIDFASKELGISRTAISNALNGRAKTAGSFVWQYV
jgi:hypothetical protein